MITIEQITEITQKHFSLYLEGNPKQKFKKMDSRYMIYHVGLKHGLRNKELAQHFQCHHTMILYGKDKISDLLTYDKAIKHLLNGIETEIEQLKMIPQ